MIDHYELHSKPETLLEEISSITDVKQLALPDVFDSTNCLILCGATEDPSEDPIKHRVIQRHSGPVDVLFLGEAPGWEELRDGVCFVGKSGKLMDQIVEKSLPGLNVVFDNVFPFKPRENTPSKKEVSCTKERAFGVICRVRPKVVVLLGQIAVSILGIRRKIRPSSGDVVRLGLPDGSLCWCVLSVHPAYILRQTYEKDLLNRVIDKVYSLCYPATDIRIEQATDLKSLLKKVERADCAFDLETTSLQPHLGMVLLCSIAWNTGKTYQARWIVNPDMRILRKWICRREGRTIMHNSKFEMKWTQPIQCPSRMENTMLRHWLIDENEPKSLDHLSIRYVGAWPYWADLPEPENFIEASDKDLGEYCCYDSAFTLKL